jgi:two-component system, OmpR family, sensor kinase
MLGLAAIRGREAQAVADPPRSDARPGTAETISAPTAPRTEPGPAHVPQPKRRVPGTRARLLATYLILLVLAAVLSTLAIRAILVVRLDERVENAIESEDHEMERHVVAGKNPVTGLTFPTLRALFDSYFAQHVTDNEEAVLTFIDGEHHRSNLEHFPLEQIPEETLARWAAFSAVQPAGESLTDNFSTDLGEGRFRLIPVELGDEKGAFVVAILPAGGLQEIGELQRVGIATTLGILLLASAAAWLIIGRTLAPVRQLTDTALSISESNLTRRVEIRGSDEAAEMAQSFNRMLDRFEAVLRSQQEFVQDAGHELRHPLTICRGQLAFISDDPDERHATIALVMDELDRMARIVEELQVLAELEQPNVLQPEPIELDSFLDGLVEKASALGPRAWVVEHEGNGTLVADRFRLTEAIMNLADNAVHHTTPDDVVAIGAAAGDEEFRLWVRDTGSGILLSDRDRIFERFTRGRGSQRGNRGSGLGLAIVKQIAEAHGGRVELESRLGLGSTFTIVLPRNPGEEEGSWPES